ncbi:uncharacterized protein LOC107815322 isoform X2 [Nicotiana tabacum]|uniref:Uncharacterized protein LOC107815322 isoform X2 n=1 Tax=Nicotiana tabacum TaxID=4097 RepID=A0AC58U9B0_TOBAC
MRHVNGSGISDLNSELFQDATNSTADSFRTLLSMVRRLEAQGVPTKQAEAITAAITEVLNDSLENVAQTFVSKEELQTLEMIQESKLSKFKSEVQSSQEIHGLRAQLEAAKYDVIKYCIGTLVSISAVGLAVVRILK